MVRSTPRCRKRPRSKITLPVTPAQRPSSVALGPRREFQLVGLCVHAVWASTRMPPAVRSFCAAPPSRRRSHRGDTRLSSPEPGETVCAPASAPVLPSFRNTTISTVYSGAPCGSAGTAGQQQRGGEEQAAGETLLHARHSRRAIPAVPAACVPAGSDPAVRRPATHAAAASLPGGRPDLRWISLITAPGSTLFFSSNTTWLVCAPTSSRRIPAARQRCVRRATWKSCWACCGRAPKRSPISVCSSSSASASGAAAMRLYNARRVCTSAM